jgi:hypothetical protein
MWAGKPFSVHESDAPLTVPDDVVLATEERAAPREEFDRTVADKMRAQEVRPAPPALARGGTGGAAGACFAPLRHCTGGAGAPACCWTASRALDGARPLRPLAAPPQEERQRQDELKRKRDEEEEKEYRRSLRFKVGPAWLGASGADQHTCPICNCAHTTHHTHTHTHTTHTTHTPRTRALAGAADAQV